MHTGMPPLNSSCDAGTVTLMQDHSEAETETTCQRKKRRCMWGIVILLTATALFLGVFGITIASWQRPTGLGLTSTGSLRPCPETPNCVCSEFADSTAAIAAIEFQGDPDEAWKSCLVTVATSPGASLVTSQDGYLHAEFVTPWMRFVDDVECRLDYEHNRIHVRSASRVGKGDLQTNRQRVELLRTEFARRWNGNNH